MTPEPPSRSRKPARASPSGGQAVAAAKLARQKAFEEAAQLSGSAARGPGPRFFLGGRRLLGASFWCFFGTLLGVIVFLGVFFGWLFFWWFLFFDDFTGRRPSKADCFETKP